MTNTQAEREARRRWGQKAVTSYEPDPIHPGKDPRRVRYRCTVGVVQLGTFFEVKGQGDTWEEAFANADESERIEERRYREILREREALAAT